jgi:hypothetical protein
MSARLTLRLDLELACGDTRYLGYQQKGQEDKVCKLVKSLYGLK